MDTAEARDTMVAIVQSTVAKWPTFGDMPVTVGPYPFQISVKGDLADNSNYIAALYEMAALGALPQGRYANSLTIGGVVQQ